MTLLLFLGAVGALGGVVFLYLRQQQDQARAEFGPPQVLMNNPPAGKTIPAGMAEMVSATIFGGKPIVRAELWMDGNLKSSDSSSSPGGDSTLYANFELPVPNGPHQIFVRGVDTAGSIGQSLPVSIIGGPKPEKVFHSVPVSPGETLANLARAYSTDPATLTNLNPNLGGKEPAAGTRVIVPAPPEPPPASTDAAPPDAPSSEAPISMPAVPPLQTADTSFLTLDRLMLLASPRRPAAPSDLQGKMENCNIILRWNDNADNEERHNVWMTVRSGIPRVIASLKPGNGGVVWAALTAPEAGTLSLWVEAVNAVGGQPSNVISLVVESKCAPPPTQLQIEALEITASGGHDRTYCYVSLQGTPEIRIPGEPQQFIRAKKGSGPNLDLPDLPDKKFVVPIPADGALDISGECWGWAGKNLDRLGAFSRKFTSDTWNGKQQELSGANFKIILVIGKLGDSGDSKVIFFHPGSHEDLSIPPPYDVKENKSKTSEDPLGRPFTMLTWKWDGDQTKIDGFRIYLGDVPYTMYPLPPYQREVYVKLPTKCGARISWRVTAVKGDAESKPSDYLDGNTYWQPDCNYYVMVKFDKIDVHPPDQNQSDMCHWDSMYYGLTVNETTLRFGGPEPGVAEGSTFTSLNKCGTYSFLDLASASRIPMPDTIVVPIPKENIKVHLGFWARNMPGLFQPGTLEMTNSYYAWNSVSEAAAYLGCGMYASLPRYQNLDYSGAPTYIGAPKGSGTGPYGLQKSFGGIHIDFSYQMQVFPLSTECPPKEPPYIPVPGCPRAAVIACAKGKVGSGSYRWPFGP